MLDIREWVRKGAGGACTRRSLGLHLLHLQNLADFEGKGKTRPNTPLHALACPHTPSALLGPKPHALSQLWDPQDSDPSTYTKLAEGVFYPSGLHLPKRLMAWFIPGVNHALGSNCYPRLRAFTANNFFGTLLKEYKPLPLWHFWYLSKYYTLSVLRIFVHFHFFSRLKQSCW